MHEGFIAFSWDRYLTESEADSSEIHRTHPTPRLVTQSIQKRLQPRPSSFVQSNAVQAMGRPSNADHP